MEIPLIGVIGTSMKEDERRVPIHPEHFDRIPPNILQKLIFEKGYGLPFNISDEKLSQRTGGVSSRSSLLSDVGIVIVAKPVVSDLKTLKKGGVLWGYTLCSTRKNDTSSY